MMAHKPTQPSSKAKSTIWCLFSVANAYDQPANNLERWWSNKPSIEMLAAFLACPLGTATDQQIADVVAIWQGKPTVMQCDTQYRLQEVAEAEAI